MTEADYFSDRERGARARINDTMPATVAHALLRLIDVGIGRNLFAQDFPRECPDGRGVVGCDREELMTSLEAEVPDLARGETDPPWMTAAHSAPDTLAVLDAMEFLYRHASAASNGTHHEYFDHHHLRFDRRTGRKELRAAVNRLLSRNGLVYELDAGGRIRRLVSAVVEEQLRRRLPATRDDAFDTLLETAIHKFTDPDPRVRRDALEKLWDAFERSKTMLHADKRKGAKALIASCAASPREAEMLDAEMRELTALGNQLAIRHHETGTSPFGEATVDHLFARMYALLLHVHPALQTG